MNRRAFLTSASASALAVAGVAACSTSVSGVQVVADLSGAISGLQTAVPALIKADPSLIPANAASKIVTYLAEAGTALGSITPASPSATTLQQVETYLNDTLDVLAAIPVIPAPYNLLIEAAAAVAPEVEAYVNTLLPAAASGRPASAKAEALAKGMTLERARQILGTAH